MEACQQLVVQRSNLSALCIAQRVALDDRSRQDDNDSQWYAAGKQVENVATGRVTVPRPSPAARGRNISLSPMGQPPREKGPSEFPPSGAWIGSVLRLPQGLDLRRSASRRRSAPVGSGSFVHQTAPTERISSTLSAARTPRRSGPSYSRTWPRRSGAFQYSHRREPVRQTIANRSGTASTPIGIPVPSCRMSWARAYCRGDWRQFFRRCSGKSAPAMSYVRAGRDCPTKHPSGASDLSGSRGHRIVRRTRPDTARWSDKRFRHGRVRSRG